MRWKSSRDKTSWLFIPFGFLFALLFAQNPAYAVTDLSSLVQQDENSVNIVTSYQSFNRRTSVATYQVSVENIGEALTGPVYLLIDNITSTSVSVANAEDQTTDGAPLFLLLESDLSAGQTASKTIAFDNSSRVRFSFTPVVHSSQADIPPDTTPLSISVNQPLAGIITNNPVMTVSGIVEAGTTQVAVNGAIATLSSENFTVDLQLKEGRNLITAVASNGIARVGSSSVQIVLDTDPPRVTVETPADGSVITSLQVDVAGLVNDLVTGTTINPDDCHVFVNGVQAHIANRAWVVPNLLLQRGLNNLEVTATDRAGNSRTIFSQVTVQDQAGQRIVQVSGSGQSEQIGTQLPDPLVVTLLNADGDPVANQPVTFNVTRGAGQVTAFPHQGNTVIVNTDENGLASVLYTLGDRVGAGNHRVSATALGFVGTVEFCHIATGAAASRITTVFGDRQTGIGEQELPLPLVALVTDHGGNPAGGVDVTYSVVDGGGNFNGDGSILLTTNSDGLVSSHLTLGPQAGINNNVVTASFEGLTESPATFSASGRAGGPASETTVSGVVLDNQDNPMPNVTVYLEMDGVVLDPIPTAITDDQGQFSILNAPVGTLHLVADGTTTTRPGRWPKLMFDLTTKPGIDNTVGLPIWMLPFADNGVIVQDGGPLQDVVIQMPNIPGAEITVKANSVHCPHGQSQCEIIWTQVRGERVPMEPPLGSTFSLAWTLQPAGAHFDPPVKVCLPNSGLEIGEQAEMYSFDHDIADFVAIGSATVMEDGAQLCSDPGFGILKAGWGGAPPPPPPEDCPNNCDDGNSCTSDSCVNGSCSNDPVSDGIQCGDGSICGVFICQSGLCQSSTTKVDGSACDDSDICTEDDQCESGECAGDKIPDDVNFPSAKYGYNFSERGPGKVIVGLLQKLGITKEIKAKIGGSYVTIDQCCKEKQDVVENKRASVNVEVEVKLAELPIPGLAWKVPFLNDAKIGVFIDGKAGGSASAAPILYDNCKDKWKGEGSGSLGSSWALSLKIKDPTTILKATPLSVGAVVAGSLKIKGSSLTTGGTLTRFVKSEVELWNHKITLINDAKKYGFGPYVDDIAAFID